MTELPRRLWRCNRGFGTDFPPNALILAHVHSVQLASGVRYDPTGLRRAVLDSKHGHAAVSAGRE